MCLKKMTLPVRALQQTQNVGTSTRLPLYVQKYDKTAENGYPERRPQRSNQPNSKEAIYGAVQRNSTVIWARKREQRIKARTLLNLLKENVHNACCRHSGRSKPHKKHRTILMCWVPARSLFEPVEIAQKKAKQMDSQTKMTICRRQIRNQKSDSELRCKTDKIDDEAQKSNRDTKFGTTQLKNKPIEKKALVMHRKWQIALNGDKIEADPLFLRRCKTKKLLKTKASFFYSTCCGQGTWSLLQR